MAAITRYSCALVKQLGRGRGTIAVSALKLVPLYRHEKTVAWSRRLPRMQTGRMNAMGWIRPAARSGADGSGGLRRQSGNLKLSSAIL